jgi:hypothetical protein
MTPGIKAKRNTFNRKAAGQAYRVALLMTASCRAAEAALTRAMLGARPGPSWARIVMVKTISHAAEWSGPAEAACSSVHPTLGPVFALSERQRHCFVLRILERVPAESCARLLRLTPSEVNSAAALGAQSLVAASRTRAA